MKKAVLILFLFVAFPVYADTTISGPISFDTTWSPAGGVYIIDSNFSVLLGVTLTIEPGTIIKARTTALGGPSIYGRLIANGTSELPIRFTSISDDTPGGWQGLYFKPGSEGSFDHVTISYAGYGGFGFGNFVGIENDGGIVAIKNSLIDQNNQHGIWQKAGTLVIENTTISNHMFGLTMWGGAVTATSNSFLSNSQYGLHASGGDSLSLTGNDFTGNARTAYVVASLDFSHVNNTSEDIANRGFETSGEARDGAVWHTSDLPFILNELIVGSGKTLKLSAGTVFKMGPGAYLDVRGFLISNGTADAPIYFTSLKDDSVLGDTNGDGAGSSPNMTDWDGLTFRENSVGNISHSVIKYSGGFNGTGRSAIFNLGGNLLLDNIIFSDNYQSDIYQNAGALTATKIDFSTPYNGLIFDGGTGDISQSKFYALSNAIDNRSGVIIDARHNWWGSVTGPQTPDNPAGTGGSISGSVLYFPWLTSDPLEVTASPHNPVIIVPGIMGSYLNREDGTEVWMNLLKMALPGDDSYLDELKLSVGGEPTNVPPLKSENVIRKTGSEDFFDGLIEKLKLDGYEEELDLFVFPYDWRLDVQNSSLELRDEIDRIRSQTGAEKVDIIAHSMGGLLLKEYLRQYGGEFIGKFLGVGTPHIGSSKSLKILMYGDNLNATILFGLFGLNSQRTKIISQNMPSVYELLPSSLYGNYLYDLDDLDNNGVRGLLSYADTKEFMKNTGRNSSLVDRADAFHQGIDNLNHADYGVKTYNIVGCGTQTLDKIFILNKETSGDVEYNISYTNGDGTVPLKSAEAITANKKTYYLKNATHALIPSTSGVKELIAGILTATSTEDFDISSYPNLATTSTGCTIPDGRIVSFHSPIELHVYDAEGNHTGPNADGDIENNIPGVSYDVIDGNKFAFLPDGVEYTIKGTATDNGTFNARIETVENEVVIETRYFNQVSIVSTTQIELKNDSVLIDNESDGIFESEFPVSSILDENQSSDLTKPVTTVTVVGKKKRSEPYTAPIKVTLVATDDNSGVLKTEYSVTGEQNWTLYTKPFRIRTKGRTHLLYRSTDRAGNVESPKFIDIDIFKKNSGSKK